MTKSRGLSISAVLSGGKDAEKTVSWKKVKLKNFDQELEFPDFWSDTAVEITASKYFRKTGSKPDAPCEKSLRQLVNRVLKALGQSATAQK